MRRLAIPPARWLSDCRKWHVDSAHRQTLQKKAACTRLPTGEEGVQPTDLAKTCPVSGQVLFSWGGSRLRLGEQKLSSCSLHAEFRLDSVWLSPVWRIYPDFTSDIPPRSHNGLPLTPINSVWDGYNKVLQMFGITDTDLRVTQLTFAAEKLLFALWDGVFIYLGSIPVSTCASFLASTSACLLELLCLWNDTDGWIVSHFDQKLNGGQLISCATGVKLTAIHTNVFTGGKGLESFLVFGFLGNLDWCLKGLQILVDRSGWQEKVKFTDVLCLRCVYLWPPEPSGTAFNLAREMECFLKLLEFFHVPICDESP